MRQTSKRTLNDLKSKLAQAQPVFVDNTGHLYSNDRQPDPAPEFAPRSPSAQVAARAAKMRAVQTPPPEEPLETVQGMRVKPNRWF